MFNVRGFEGDVMLYFYLSGVSRVLYRQFCEVDWAV